MSCSPVSPCVALVYSDLSSALMVPANLFQVTNVDLVAKTATVAIQDPATSEPNQLVTDTFVALRTAVEDSGSDLYNPSRTFSSQLDSAAAPTATFSPTPFVPTHNVGLEDNLQMAWSVSGSDVTIRMRLFRNAWVGVGVNEDDEAKMIGSDVVIAKIAEGTTLPYRLNAKSSSGVNPVCLLPGNLLVSSSDRVKVVGCSFCVCHTVCVCVPLPLRCLAKLKLILHAYPMIVRCPCTVFSVLFLCCRFLRV